MRIFDLVAVGRVGIIVFGAGIFAKRAKASCTTLAVSNNQEKHLGSSRDNNLVRLGNE